MAFTGIGSGAIVAAAVASYIFGSLWYMLLAKPWMAALGKTADQLSGQGPVWVPYLTAFLAQLVMAWIFAGLLGHLGATMQSVRSAMISGALLWAGFIATTLVVNHRFGGQRWALTVIDAGHWLGVMLVQGAVLGALAG